MLDLYAMKKSLSILIAALIVLTACKKDSVITSNDARLNISADTLKFDTVLTSVGSITQSFKIFNDNDQRLVLSTVKLMGGAASSYRININGSATIESNNIELDANDSIYVFVTVNINPSAANLPFIISDSILIDYNGNNRFVQLQSYGQNAHFLAGTSVSTNTTWTNDLPYVILGSLQVDTGVTLTINEGTQIYAHANAPFIVDGTLLINGTKGNEVQFASDRLDDPYRDFPGGWPGIYFRNTSINNRLTFAIVKNAYQAIVVQGQPANTNPKLTVQQCIIDNAFDVGLYCINSSVAADNSLISNCGTNIRITGGGNYSFVNCTVAAYSNNYLLHKIPVLTIQNYTQQGGVIIPAPLDATFTNCIFWGDDGIVDDEIIVDRQGTQPFNLHFDHCIYRATNDPANSTFSNAIRNADPIFDSIDTGNRYYDFRITKDDFAPGLNQGAPVTFPSDLDNNNRSNGLPDIGSFEKQ
jgi:hypothetical protein